MTNYHLKWSKEEIRILKELYSKVPNREIQKILKDRSVDSIQKKAHNLGLHYPTGGEINYEYLKRLEGIVKGEDIELSGK